MSTTDIYPPGSGRGRLGDGPYDRPTWFAQVRHALATATGWLDERGRPAWAAATVAAFVVTPPIGVALLLYILGTGRMFSSRHHDRHADRAERRMGCGSKRDRMDGWRQARAAMRPSGNATFDAYKADTLRRLEEEQQSFEAFLHRLREAKDKAEFDQFMEDRARKAGSDENQDAA